MAEPARRTGAYVLETTPTSSAPATARLFVGAVLRNLGHGGELIDTMKLVVSELVTASVQAGTAPVITVSIDAAASVIEVHPVGAGELAEDLLATALIAELVPDFALPSSGSEIIIPIPAATPRRQ